MYKSSKNLYSVQFTNDLNIIMIYINELELATIKYPENPSSVQWKVYIKNGGVASILYYIRKKYIVQQKLSYGLLRHICFRCYASLADQILTLSPMHHYTRF